METDQSFTLDGQPVPFSEGQTIMDAVMAAGGYIPHLCHNPRLAPHGSCRVCIVRIGERFVSACTQPAVAGLEVDNSSVELTALRRAVIQMIFVEGNHVCPACEKSGACQLQAVAYYVGMLGPRYAQFFPHRSVDASHAGFAIDHNRCILCELCVRASRDLDGKRVFAVAGRGIHSRLVVNSPTGKLGDSAFDEADRAAHVCPVGAILPKHRGYEVPIGKRLYDCEPISLVGDVAANTGGD